MNLFMKTPGDQYHKGSLGYIRCHSVEFIFIALNDVSAFWLFCYNKTGILMLSCTIDW